MLTSMMRGLMAAGALFLVAGCGEDAGTISAGDAGSSAPPDGGTPNSCTAGQAQACTCPASGSAAAKSGSQACYQGNWLLCNCQATDVPPPVTTGGSCVAGRYEGSFRGDYRSGFAFGFGIPVEALDFSGQPGLAFTLNENTGGACGEFCNYSISDGYVKGTANGVFPFEGVLTGTLDCNTRKFEGKLVGCYALGVALGINVGHFEGPVKGTYDGNTHEFTIGSWDVLEANVATGFFGTVGGNGTWNAKYNAMPTGVAPMGTPTCTGGPIDAGTPTGDASP